MPEPPRDDPWWRYGLCTQVGPELFFLRIGEPGTEAKRVCRGCDVRLSCLADAITTDIEHGIFGGLGREERRVLSKQVLNGKSPRAVAAAAIRAERKVS